MNAAARKLEDDDLSQQFPSQVSLWLNDCVYVS